MRKCRARAGRCFQPKNLQYGIFTNPKFPNINLHRCTCSFPMNHFNNVQATWGILGIRVTFNHHFLHLNIMQPICLSSALPSPSLLPAKLGNVCEGELGDVAGFNKENRWASCWASRRWYAVWFPVSSLGPLGELALLWDQFVIPIQAVTRSSIRPLADGNTWPTRVQLCAAWEFLIRVNLPLSSEMRMVFLGIRKQGRWGTLSCLSTHIQLQKKALQF